PRVADVARGRKTIRQNDLTDLIVEREIETADIEIEIGKRLPAHSIFKLERIAFFKVAIYHAARSSWDQFPVGNRAVGLRYRAVKFNTRRATGCDNGSRRILDLCTLFSCDGRRRDDLLAFDQYVVQSQSKQRHKIKIGL